MCALSGTSDVQDAQLLRHWSTVGIQEASSRGTSLRDDSAISRTISAPGLTPLTDMSWKVLAIPPSVSLTGRPFT